MGATADVASLEPGRVRDALERFVAEWTGDRAAIYVETFDLRRSTRRLFERHPENTFLVKASYWFNP